MWKNILSNVVSRQVVKGGTQVAIKEQQRLQKFHQEKRKMRETSRDIGEERVIYRAYPPMVDYYASVGPFWTGLMVFMMIVLVGILLYIFGTSVYEYGWAYTLNDIKTSLEGCRWYHVVGLILFALFMGALFFVSPFLTKYMENTVTIFTNRCVYIQRYLRKEKIVTYEELAKSIKRRKISIKNGRYVIPYRGTSISIPMIEGVFPSELFSLLERKCGIDLPYGDVRNRAQRSGVGWACGHLGGGILMIFSLFIAVLVFAFEGVFTWQRALFDLYNPITWFAIGLVALGLLLNIFFWPSTWLGYRDYRKVIRVSLMPILTDYLILYLSIGLYMYCSHAGIWQQELAVEKSAAEVQQEFTERFVASFSRDVWGKDFHDVTEEEFASIKYISIDFGGEGNTVVKYSTKDYRDCVDEQEFLESIQTWQCAEDEIITSPADISMFTGLTYVETPEYEELEELILPKENQIARLKIEESPVGLIELVNPEEVEVLQIHHYDFGNAFGCLEQFSNLKELEYTNSWWDGEVDLSKLSCLDSLERLHLACGESYVNLDVLEKAENLQSLYIDNATLQQCGFVERMPQLEEVCLCYGEGGDLSVLADLPRLRTLWLLDTMEVDASELEGFRSLEALRVTINDQEALDTIAQFHSELSVLQLRMKDRGTGIYFGDTSVYDLSGLAKLDKLKELDIVFEGYFATTGLEKVLDIQELSALSLAGSMLWSENVLYIDTLQLHENSSIKSLFLGGCLPMDMETGEVLTDQFLSGFKGAETITLCSSLHGLTSFDCLEGCDSLQTLYLRDVMLTEEQEQKVKALEEKLEVIYD